MSGDQPTTTSSTDATTVVLGDAHFKPLFTYPIFGEAELLYGFCDPQITVEFDPWTLLPLIEFTSSGKDQPKTDEKENPVNTLMEFMSPDTQTNRSAWESLRSSEKEASVQQQRGTEFAKLGTHFTLYKAPASSAQKLLHRLRLFVLFFIEAGSYIDDTDPAWELYTLYHDEKGFAGFATVYPYFCYEGHDVFDAQDSEPTKRPVRRRISQFVVLPPFQRQGLGQSLYTALANAFTTDPLVRQVTVEDPNELFDDLRDRADLVRLPKLSTKWREELSASGSIDGDTINELATELKLVHRQAHRLVEMTLLILHEPKVVKVVNALVKGRLYEKNYEGLADFDPAQQREMIQQAYDQVLVDYRRVIEPVQSEVVALFNETEIPEPPSKRSRIE